MSEPSGDAPKIIVDDDWKSQVEREKQQAAQAAQSQAAQPQADGSESQPASGKTEAPAPAADAPIVDAQAAEALAADAAAAQTPPPATIEMLVTMLFTQAMAALGQFPGPDGKPAPINKPFAKYFIDTVELLGEKTKGNLSEDESLMLADTLHAMRMAFVSVKAK